MKRVLPVSLALTLGLAAAARAEVAPQFAEGTPVVIVGEITSQPRDAGIIVENKMQVGIGPEKTDYTLHLSDALLRNAEGGEAFKSDFRDRMWVRAEGFVMDDPRRINVSRLQIIGEDLPSLRRSAFYRPGFDHGYVIAASELGDGAEVVARSESYSTDTYRVFPLSQLGRWPELEEDPNAGKIVRREVYRRYVRSVDVDTDIDAARVVDLDDPEIAFYDGTPVPTPEELPESIPAPPAIRVLRNGEIYTVRIPQGGGLTDADGAVVARRLENGEWVRLRGYHVADGRLFVKDVDPADPGDVEIYRERTAPGYLERVAGSREALPITITGTVFSVYPDMDYFTVRDATGRVHRVYRRDVEIREDGRIVRFESLRVGDHVTVSGYPVN